MMQSGRQSHFLVPAMCLVLLMIGSGIGMARDQRKYESVTESPRLFDADKSESIRGTIAKLQSVVPAQGATDFMQLEIKTAGGLVTVHLAPLWYLEEHQDKIELDKGMEVEVRGSHAVVNGKDVLVAAEILRVQNGERLHLRHQDGTPVWSGSERSS